MSRLALNVGATYHHGLQAELVRATLMTMLSGPRRCPPHAPHTSSQVTPVTSLSTTAADRRGFGVNDLLQVYNAQQDKHRLNSTSSMYVANTKGEDRLHSPGCSP